MNSQTCSVMTYISFDTVKRKHSESRSLRMIYCIKNQALCVPSICVSWGMC